MDKNTFFRNIAKRNSYEVRLSEGALTRVRWNPVALVIGSLTMGGCSVSLGIFITIAKFYVVPVQRPLQFVFSQKWC